MQVHVPEDSFDLRPDDVDADDVVLGRDGRGAEDVAREARNIVFQRSSALGRLLGPCVQDVGQHLLHQGVRHRLEALASPKVDRELGVAEALGLPAEFLLQAGAVRRGESRLGELGLVLERQQLQRLVGLQDEYPVLERFVLPEPAEFVLLVDLLQHGSRDDLGRGERQAVRIRRALGPFEHEPKVERANPLGPLCRGEGDEQHERGHRHTGHAGDDHPAIGPQGPKDRSQENRLVFELVVGVRAALGIVLLGHSGHVRR